MSIQEGGISNLAGQQNERERERQHWSKAVVVCLQSGWLAGCARRLVLPPADRCRQPLRLSVHTYGAQPSLFERRGAAAIPPTAAAGRPGLWQRRHQRARARPALTVRMRSKGPRRRAPKSGVRSSLEADVDGDSERGAGWISSPLPPPAAASLAEPLLDERRRSGGGASSSSSAAEAAVSSGASGGGSSSSAAATAGAGAAAAASSSSSSGTSATGASALSNMNGWCCCCQDVEKRLLHNASRSPALRPCLRWSWWARW